MLSEEIKKKINSTLKNVSAVRKSKKARLKKPIFSIFSGKSNEEQIRKISPLFQTTSAEKSVVLDKSKKTKFPGDRLKNLSFAFKKNIKIYIKKSIKNLGFTEELTNIWGLDIGTEYVKLLRISHEEDLPVITNFSCESIPARFRNTDSSRYEYLKQFLRKIVLKYKIEGEVVNSSIADPSVIIRTIKLPQMAECEIPKAVKWRLAQQYAVDLNKQIVRFNIIKRKEDIGVKQIEILTINVPKKIVMEHFSLVKQSGLRPIAIEPECFPLTFCFLENYKWEPDEIVVLLNVGAKYTIFNLVINGSLNFSRRILFGASDIFDALANNLNISPEEAGRKLTKFGIPQVNKQYKVDDQYVISGGEGSSESEEMQIFRAIQFALERLVVEFQKTFNFYSYQLARSAVQKIDRIFITGGASQLRNLDKFLNVRLEIPVETLNPLKDIQIAQGVDKKSIEQFSSQLGVAIGLALRRKI